jgi:nicotinic acid phosphoribosyltransferase
MSISKSIILNTDSYKVSMPQQYPAGTTGIYSYIESRGGHYDTTLFFGIQAFIKEYLLLLLKLISILETKCGLHMASRLTALDGSIF